jgi:hypothetical protein
LAISFSLLLKKMVMICDSFGMTQVKSLGSTEWESYNLYVKSHHGWPCNLWCFYEVTHHLLTKTLQLTLLLM